MGTEINLLPSCLLVAGYPLFPGENEVEQLACMMEVLGVPPRKVLEQASRKKMFFGKEFESFVVVRPLLSVYKYTHKFRFCVDGPQIVTAIPGLYPTLGGRNVTRGLRI
jgi:hypothetical protein